MGPCLRGSRRSKKSSEMGSPTAGLELTDAKVGRLLGHGWSWGGAMRSSDSLQFFTVLCQPSDREKMSSHTGGTRTGRGEAL